MFFDEGANFGAAQISDPILEIWITFEHVAKFGKDWPSDLRD